SWAMCRSTRSTSSSAATTRFFTRASRRTGGKICTARQTSYNTALESRITAYRREDLHRPQSIDKTVFEYWTHALSYVPTRDLRFFVRSMKRDWGAWSAWFGTVKVGDTRKVLGRIRRNGPLTIRDIDDDVLVGKDHECASRS